MILEAISGYLSDRGVKCVFHSGIDCVEVRRYSDRRFLSIHCSGGRVRLYGDVPEFIFGFDVCDPGLFGRVLGKVREYLAGGGCDDS
jgi:hypothetical protein